MQKTRDCSYAQIDTYIHKGLDIQGICYEIVHPICDWDVVLSII